MVTLLSALFSALNIAETIDQDPYFKADDGQGIRQTLICLGHDIVLRMLTGLVGNMTVAPAQHSPDETPLYRDEIQVRKGRPVQACIRS